MSDDFDTAKTEFINIWLIDITKTFREAVIQQSSLEAHFNGLSAGELASTLLGGLVEDMERYDFCLDSNNVYDVDVHSVIDNTGVELQVSFPYGKRSIQ